MKKTKLLFFTQLSLIALLIMPAFTQAIDIQWQVGDNYNFELYFHIIDNEKDLETGAENKFDYVSTNTFTANITDIDNSTEEIDYDLIYHDDSIDSNNGEDYTADDFINDFPQLTDILQLTLKWDYVNNETVYSDFDFIIDYYMFLEPNWSIINDHFVSIFNTSTIISSLADPYEPIIHNVTLGDFLNSINEYTIMGIENDLTTAKNQFTATTNQWSFYFDLANALEASYDNGTYDIYSPVEKGDFSFVLGYQSNGVLQKFDYDIEAIYTTDNSQYHVRENIEIWYGNRPTEESGFNFLLIIPVLSFLTIVQIVRFKRKH